MAMNRNKRYFVACLSIVYAQSLCNKTNLTFVTNSHSTNLPFTMYTRSARLRTGLVCAYSYPHMGMESRGPSQAPGERSFGLTLSVKALLGRTRAPDSSLSLYTTRLAQDAAVLSLLKPRFVPTKFLSFFDLAPFFSRPRPQELPCSSGTPGQGPLHQRKGRSSPRAHLT